MQSIGERLEEARKKKGISIREAAEATKIRGDYLQQFENNRFDINLTEIYVRGFLRGYATYLKLPAEKLLNDYASLGRGEARPRQPSREVYGRMDVSIASAEERGDSAAEEPPTPPPARRPSPVTRGTRPATGPAIDPATLFKFGKWAAAIVVIVLIVWGISSLFRGSNPAPANRPVTSPVAPANSSPAVPTTERTITLVALDAVRVTVTQKNPDGSEGDILYQGTLARNQTKSVSWPGPIYISASEGANLTIEYKGNRYPTRFTGSGRAQMQ
ncbi:MAG: transcriptional regulator, family [Verrucomicrobia bacterium]|nr:transcriptional regulator, family [Verrucomicrobiota bacterium]